MKHKKTSNMCLNNMLDPKLQEHYIMYVTAPTNMT